MKSNICIKLQLCSLIDAKTQALYFLSFWKIDETCLAQSFFLSTKPRKFPQCSPQTDYLCWLRNRKTTWCYASLKDVFILAFYF